MTESRQERSLRERYKGNLPGKAAEIAAYQVKFKEVADSDELNSLLEELHQHLHKLAGSSGMYGYTGIAECARTAIRIVLERNSPEVESQLLVLRNLLERHA